MQENAYEKMNIQWFPGHMTKAQRMIEENVKLVDAVCEILDARIPNSSRNPDIDRLAAGKPRLIILNRCDLADKDVTDAWVKYFTAQGLKVMQTDAKSGKGVNGFARSVRELLTDKLKDYAAKGQATRPSLVNTPEGVRTHNTNFVAAASTVTMNSNWHHAVLVYAGSAASVYVDGGILAYIGKQP